MIISTSEQGNHNIASKNAIKNIAYTISNLLTHNIAKLLYMVTPNEFLHVSLF